MLVATLAQKCGPAVIVVDTKGKCAKTLTHDMVLASRPFISRRRPIWHVVLEINDAQRCFFLAVKNTLTAQGQRLAFTSGGERLALKCEAQPAAWYTKIPCPPRSRAPSRVPKDAANQSVAGLTPERSESIMSLGQSRFKPGGPTGQPNGSKRCPSTLI